MAITINIPREKFVPVYRPILDDVLANIIYDIVFLYGSRDSGKTHFIGQVLIILCLSIKYFRCLLIRKVFNTIRGSQYQTIKDIIYDWGLQDYFRFREQTVEIICTLNGNSFSGRGCDDVNKLKSFRNPTHAWYEEGNELDEEDHIVVSTTLRSSITKVQEWFSFNPQVIDQEDYREHYLYKSYFDPAVVGTNEMSFIRKKEITIVKANEIKIHELTYKALHTTYNDNPYASDTAIARYELLRDTNPYFYTIFAKGLWADLQTGREYYTNYSRAIHTSVGIRYNPIKALHIAFDFNVNPYMTLLVYQIENVKGVWEITGLKEYCPRQPDNTTKAACEMFLYDLEHGVFVNHEAGLFYYGDFTSNRRNTLGIMEFQNDYDMVEYILARHITNESRRIKPNPLQIRARNFINDEILKGRSYKFTINADAMPTLANDMALLKQAPDGGMDEKEKDKLTGGVKYGHASSAQTYFLTSCFYDEYKEYGKLIYKNNA